MKHFDFELLTHTVIYGTTIAGVIVAILEIL